MFINFFTAVIEISITTSFVIALLIIISPILKKAYAAKWRYFVWLILAIRLMIPFNITLPSPPVTLPMPNNTIVFRQPINTILEAPQPQTIIQMDAPLPVLNSQAKNISLMELLTFVWLLGILVFVLYHTVVYLTFKKQVKRWRSEIISDEAASIFDRLCNDLTISIKPRLQLCKRVNSPMMFGFIKPVLLLPSENYTMNDLEVILKHELVHFKRKDLWYKLVILSANAVHWFNPFVYFMIKSANADIEISCDNEVIENSDLTFRKAYSQTILAVLHNEKLRQSALSTYFYGGTKTMKIRFENIFDMGKKRKGFIALSFVLIVTGISGFFVACKSDIVQVKIVPELLYRNKTVYVGDNSKVGGIITNLPVPSGLTYNDFILDTISEPYSVTISYQTDTETRNFYTGAVNQVEFRKNATIMFCLIDNVELVNFHLSDGVFDDFGMQFTRDGADSYFDRDIREFAKTQESFNRFLEKVDAMSSNGYSESKSIGLYDGAISEQDVIPADDKFNTIDEAIHYGLVGPLSTYSEAGEFIAEGHVTLDTQTKDNYVTVYAVIGQSGFTFINGYFTGGGGANPVVITVAKDENGKYEFVESKLPTDGALWDKSIKEMYPEKLWDKVFPLSAKLELYSGDITKQMNTQAEQYLKSIGRVAEIKNGRFDTKPIDIDVNASNKLDELRKYDKEFNKYPYWIGTQEFIENGTRYIYETYQTKSDDGYDLVCFKKTTQKEEITELSALFGYKVANGNIEEINNLTAIPIHELPKKYTVEMAVSNRDYVNVHGMISNDDVMTDFINKVNEQEKAFVRTINITTEGDPIITDFSYDGTVFKVIRDTTRDAFGRQEILQLENFSNLVLYRNDNKTAYFITNETEITKNDFENPAYNFNAVLLKVDNH